MILNDLSAQDGSAQGHIKSPFQLEVAPLFWSNYKVRENYGDEKRIIINQGGTSSGKTYALMQMFFVICINGEILAEYQDPVKHFGQPIKVRVVAKHLSSLKQDALDIAKKIAADLSLHTNIKFSYNKSEYTYTFYHPNGTESQLTFKGYDNEESAKFGKVDYVYMCEASSMKLDIFNQLEPRARVALFMDYNPTSKFWVHSPEVMNLKETIFFRTNYLDNPFVPLEIRRSIERRREDREWFKVYGLGYIGKVKGLVFPKAMLVDSFPRDAKRFRLGIDFGWQHKTALVFSVEYAGAIYAQELFYESHTQVDEVAELLAKRIMPWIRQYFTNFEDNEMQFFADSADPPAIKRLNLKLNQIEAGIISRPANKKSGVKTTTIRYLNGCPLMIVKSENNYLWEEIIAYRHKIDPITGNNSEETNDGKDHACDALRYAKHLDAILLEKEGD